MTIPTLRNANTENILNKLNIKGEKKEKHKKLDTH